MRDLCKELMDPPQPEYWHCEPGSIIVGRVLGFTTNQHTGWLHSLIVETHLVKDMHVDPRYISPWARVKKLHVSLGYPHLREQIITLAVKEGDRVGIKYLGRDKKTFHHEFRVLVDR